jgi:phage-related minor tail protein
MSGLGLPYGVYNHPTYFGMPSSGAVRKFAQGGVLGEAGPEAIMPLKRDSTGRLGVESSPVNINVINNANGTSARVEREGDDINIIIEQVRKQLVSDVRSGGNKFANALAGTYGLNRINR